MSVEQLISQITEGSDDAKITLESILMSKIAIKLDEMKAAVMSDALKSKDEDDDSDDKDDDSDDKDDDSDDKEDDSDDKEDDDENDSDGKLNVGSGAKDKAEVKE